MATRRCFLVWKSGAAVRPLHAAAHAVHAQSHEYIANTPSTATARLTFTPTNTATNTATSTPSRTNTATNTPSNTVTATPDFTKTLTTARQRSPRLIRRPARQRTPHQHGTNTATNTPIEHGDDHARLPRRDQHGNASRQPRRERHADQYGDPNQYRDGHLHTDRRVRVSGTFYRAINLAGTALVIDGNNWEADAAPNFTTTGTATNSATWQPLNPTTDANRTAMIQTFRAGWNTTLTMSNMPNGSYTVYLYELETWQSRSYSISVQGTVVVPTFSSGAAGTWHKLGPWTASVTNGTLTVSTYGDTAQLSGLEVWSNTTPTFMP